jgi:4-amino-4-deoxy-L-arabinose transferase-like glycosyltransferase
VGSSRRSADLLLWVLAVAAVVRFAAVSVASDQVWGDEVSYIRAGRAVAQGDLNLPTFFPPVYTLVIGAIFKVFGSGLLVPRLVQVLLGTLVTYLVYRLGTDLHGRRAGLVAGLLVAVLPELASFSAMFYSENVFLVLYLSAWIVFLRARGRPNPLSHCVMAGVLFGLATLTRELILYFVLLLAIGVYGLHASGQGRRAARAAAFLAPIFLLVGGWMAANYLRLGHFVLTTNRWRMLFEGNHDPADSAACRALYAADPFAGEAFARSHAIRWIADRQPGWLLEKLQSSMTSLWSPKQFLRRQMVMSGASPKWVAAISLFSAIVLAIVLVGGILGLASSPPTPYRFLLLALLCYLLLVHIGTCAVTRYRLPFIPVLAVYAGYWFTGPCSFASRLRTLASPRRLVPALVAIAGLFAIWFRAIELWSHR